MRWKEVEKRLFVLVWWFKSHTKHLSKELYLVVDDSKCSYHWTHLFFSYSWISLRQKTCTSQKVLQDDLARILPFYIWLAQVWNTGVYQDKYMANMDQTPPSVIIDWQQNLCKKQYRRRYCKGWLLRFGWKTRYNLTHYVWW